MVKHWNRAHNNVKRQALLFTGNRLRYNNNKGKRFQYGTRRSCDKTIEMSTFNIQTKTYYKTYVTGIYVLEIQCL